MQLNYNCSWERIYKSAKVTGTLPIIEYDNRLGWQFFSFFFNIIKLGFSNWNSVAWSCAELRGIVWNCAELKVAKVKVELSPLIRETKLTIKISLRIKKGDYETFVFRKRVLFENIAIFQTK